MNPQVYKALAVTCEVMGLEVSRTAVRMFALDLARFPEAQVIAALERCRKEVRGRLMVADVIDRLADGRPQPEQAWAEIPRDEETSVVWCEEQRQAWAVARTLLAEGQVVQARMAFLERYRQLCREARERGEPPRWTASMGYDRGGRVDALLRAVQDGRFTAVEACRHLPAAEHAEPQGAAAALLRAAGIVDDRGEPRRLAPLVEGLLTGGKNVLGYDVEERGRGGGGRGVCDDREGGTGADQDVPAAGAEADRDAAR